MSTAKPARVTPPGQDHGNEPPSGNIRILTLGDLKWDVSNREQSLETLIKALSDKATEASSWYLKKKENKKQRAIWFRGGAIVITTMAAILPILSQMRFNYIQPAVASILIALAAMLIGLDQFGGFSSAWMRYIGADLKIKSLYIDFQMDYQTERATWKGQTPNDDQTRRILDMSKTFISALNAVIQDETTTWIQEFKSNLTRIDESAKAASTSMMASSINLTVENGDQCPNGWMLSLDNGNPVQKRGKTVAIDNIFAGQHKIRVEEVAPGKKSGEQMVNVAPGATTSVSMPLA